MEWEKRRGGEFVFLFFKYKISDEVYQVKIQFTSFWIGYKYLDKRTKIEPNFKNRDW